MKFFAIGVALLMGVFSYAYAASITVTDAAQLGAGEATISAPGTIENLAWTASDGQATAVDVTWTPGAAGDYTVEATLMDSGCAAAVTGGGPQTAAAAGATTVQRTDSVSGFTASAELVDCTRIMIVED